MNSTTKSLLVRIVAFSWLAFLAMAANAEQIGVNTYLNGWNSGNDNGVIGAANSAGVAGYAQVNWNDKAFGSQSWTTETLLNAIDSSGNPTGTSVVWTAGVAGTGDMWFATTPNPRTTGDHRMMAMAAMEQKFVGSDGTMTVAVSSIPYSNYDVVVYFNHSDVNTTSPVSLRFTIGATPLTVTASDTYTDGTFDLSDGAGGAGNYIVFTGLSGSSFTLLQEQLADTYWNGGMTAFQIVEAAETVPEPSTFVLVGLGLAGLGLATWRKRRCRC